ncbi:hypothetical protein, partial [Natranaerobius trueperi]
RKVIQAASHSTGVTEGIFMARQELKTLLSQNEALVEDRTSTCSDRAYYERNPGNRRNDEYFRSRYGNSSRVFV